MISAPFLLEAKGPLFELIMNSITNTPTESIRIYNGPPNKPNTKSSISKVFSNYHGVTLRKLTLLT